MTEAKSWEEARSACQESDADLASITNEETNAFLSTLTTESSWIGGYKDSNNDWKWSDGSTWGYTNWCRGQPDGTGQHLIFNCVWLKNKGVAKWDDGGSATSFICQLKTDDHIGKLLIIKFLVRKFPRTKTSSSTCC